MGSWPTCSRSAALSHGVVKKLVTQTGQGVQVDRKWRLAIARNRLTDRKKNNFQKNLRAGLTPDTSGHIVSGVVDTRKNTMAERKKKELKRNESGHFDRFISPVIGAKETGFPSVTWHFIKVGVSDTTVHNSFDASRFLQRKETLRGRFRAQSWSVKFGENDWNYFVHNWIPVKKKLISFTWIPNTWA